MKSEKPRDRQVRGFSKHTEITARVRDTKITPYAGRGKPLVGIRR